MLRLSLALSALAACQSDVADPPEPPGGVVLVYPRDHQLDVPVGAHVIVELAEAGDATIDVIGPDGPVDSVHTTDGAKHVVAPSALAPGTPYTIAVDGTSLVTFVTRSDRPRAAPPELVALCGSPPDRPGSFRPILETSSLQLTFSEPLDPRTADAIELVDAAGAPVPATLLADGIHATLDPIDPLVPGAPYELRLGDALRDAGGQPFVATAIPIPFTPVASRGATPVQQAFRTVPAERALALAHPLIGEVTGGVLPSVITTELGDPEALGGPIAFAIPKGQRFAASPLPIALAGAVPSGLVTGDVEIELVADGGGLLYRERDGGPLLVDMSLDLAIYATDPTGNGVLAQTVLGVQLTGRATAHDGALAIESVGAIDIALLGIATAPANLVLELASDPTAVPALDATPPTLLASDGLALVFDEPVEPRGVVARDLHGDEVPALIESHGAALVVRPRGPAVQLELAAVTDLAGNAMAPVVLPVASPNAAATPPSLLAVEPGAPCALAGDRCAGGRPTDDAYAPFAVGAGEPLRVTFDQPMAASSLVLGAACGTGSVRVEQLDAAGQCTGAVAGTLLRHERDVTFVPDPPWQPDQHYRLRVVSGPDASCAAGEVCGANGMAASFDPLAGMKPGGPDLVIDFAATAQARRPTLVASAAPGADTNRVALRIAGTSGLITSASFAGADCVPATPEHEACMSVLGSVPAQLGEPRSNCALPDGTAAATCIPVAMAPAAMYSSSVTMTAAALGIGITTATGTSVMRVRRAETYIVERDGAPVAIAALDLYMDAPDMSLPLSQHDLHSKPLSVVLAGPVLFRPDGRLALELASLADLPITVAINAPLGISGTVQLVAPQGEMKLELLTPPPRGGLP